MKALGLAPVAVLILTKIKAWAQPLFEKGFTKQTKMDGCACSCSVILVTTIDSDFASRLPKAIAAVIQVITLWLCHSAMFHKPDKSFYPKPF